MGYHVHTFSPEAETPTGQFIGIAYLQALLRARQRPWPTSCFCECSWPVPPSCLCLLRQQEQRV